MTHLQKFSIAKLHYFRTVENINLNRGFIRLMDNRIVVEGDDAISRKRMNMAIYGGLFFLLLLYVYSSYQQYRSDPHSFDSFLSVIQFLLFLTFLVPGAINRVFRFSTINEIPYSSIRKHELSGTLLKWGSAVKLYMQDNQIRTLWLNKEEMTKFRNVLDQKIQNNILLS